ncbi:hypothetical protein GQ55_9G515500 [Panicum hallii var. hallii]|uniref:Uncharacterized protein n=1 Tax=Panicum hallii var. hallii TaxID=1504633 RepID=A0A2T7CDZ9_9POAL|nr:hypothetical protein GQ55_9G515500 [Panicum hallii var. hallii]
MFINYQICTQMASTLSIFSIKCNKISKFKVHNLKAKLAYRFKSNHTISTRSSVFYFNSTPINFRNRYAPKSLVLPPFFPYGATRFRDPNFIILTKQ